MTASRPTGIAMLVIWKADFEGDPEDVEKVSQLFERISKEIGGRWEGPYYPQDASLLYLFHVDKYEWLNRSGRIFLKEVEKQGLKVTPISYEIAVTPEEFWEK